MGKTWRFHRHKTGSSPVRVTNWDYGVMANVDACEALKLGSIPSSLSIWGISLAGKFLFNKQESVVQLHYPLPFK